MLLFSGLFYPRRRVSVRCICGTFETLATLFALTKLSQSLPGFRASVERLIVRCGPRAAQLLCCRSSNFQQAAVWNAERWPGLLTCRNLVVRWLYCCCCCWRACRVCQQHSYTTAMGVRDPPGLVFTLGSLVVFLSMYMYAEHQRFAAMFSRFVGRAQPDRSD